MNEIITIINYFPLIISYVAYGAIFLSVYKFIRVRDNASDLKTYFIACVTISFVIKSIYKLAIGLVSARYLLFMPEDSAVYFLVGCLFTVVTAYISGMICNSEWFNNLLLAVGIQRTTNSSIWVDILKPHTWLYIHLKGKDYAYMGEHEYSEENTSNPKIILCNYQLVELSTANVVTDYSDDPNRKIMIDTDSADIIEIIYEDNTSFAKKKMSKVAEPLRQILNK